MGNNTSTRRDIIYLGVTNRNIWFRLNCEISSFTFY